MNYDWGQGGKGAAGGAMTGAAMGSVIPGIGTGVGAIVGGGLGLLAGFGGGESDNDAAYRKMLLQSYGQGPTQAPQLGAADQADYSTFRGSQAGLINRLEAMANGTGPSLARQQFQAATDRNMRGQQAMAASGRGGPLAQLTAANNMAQLGANAAQGSTLARTNEQMQAIGHLGGVINQGRMADENVNQFNVGQRNQFQVQNLNSRLMTMGMDDPRRLQILQLLGALNAGQANKPGTGDQLMAGGAGMFSMAATQKAQQKAMQSQGGGGFSVTTQANPGYFSGMPTSSSGSPNNWALFNQMPSNPATPGILK